MSVGSPGAAAYECSPNIALIKYWGVRDPRRTLPWNSSVSVTLDRLRSRTAVRFEGGRSEDEFRLDGAAVGGRPLDDVIEFLDRVRGAAGIRERAVVDSSNNFQTASGLASSASGFAALAGAATRAAGLNWSDRRLSQLARLGSGSACRSIYGGFVEWRRGTRSDGSDCYARPVFGEDHWPELVDVVAIVKGAPTKPVRSAAAMQSSVATSPGYAHRQKELPGRVRKLLRALRDRDAPRLFDLVMEECDSFRDVCETTDPPLDYLTATSRSVLAAVRAENERAGRAVAGYTHDAGAHVHVFTLTKSAARLRRRLGSIEGVDRTLLLRPGPGGRAIPLPRGR